MIYVTIVTRIRIEWARLQKVTSVDHSSLLGIHNKFNICPLVLKRISLHTALTSLATQSNRQTLNRSLDVNCSGNSSYFIQIDRDINKLLLISKADHCDQITSQTAIQHMKNKLNRVTACEAGLHPISKPASRLTRNT